jgi:hypothetical protein
MRKQMKLRRRGLRGLGAVEGEKVEYFLPASIFNKLGTGAKSAIALCFSNVEDVLPYILRQGMTASSKAKRMESRSAAYSTSTNTESGYWASVAESRAKTAARSAKLQAKAGDVFEQTAAEIQKDLAALRAQGITGPIPMCAYRTSGKYGDKALKSAEARANRHHERFHADARRAEYKAGAKPHACDGNITTVLGSDLDPELYAFSRRYWSPSGRAAAEEILARVEEAEQSCGNESGDCGDVLGRVNDWFISKGKPELATSFAQAVLAVKAKHGGPLEVMKKACRAPSGFSGLRRRGVR